MAKLIGRQQLINYSVYRRASLNTSLKINKFSLLDFLAKSNENT